MRNSTPERDSGTATLLEHPVQRRPIRLPVFRLSVDVPRYFLRKAIWMKTLAAMLFIGLSPLILLTMLLVRLTSPGPALFRQTRLGKDGQIFEILKIRTMHWNAEQLTGPMLCLPSDSRITPIGRLLRFLHLDELPQLINVIRGEMCLVGPRPERPEIIARHRLNEIVPGFSARTKVLPGVTGLAQINLPADQTAECVIPKVQLDLEYIMSASAGLDLRILLCTAMRMLGVRQGRAVKLFRLNRPSAMNFGPAHRSLWEFNRHQNGRHVNGTAAMAFSLSDGVGMEATQLINMTISDPKHGDAVESIAQQSNVALPPLKPR